MWNYFKGLFITGGLFKKIAAITIGFFGVITILAVLFSMKGRGIVFGSWAAWWFATKYNEKFGKTFKDIEHVPYWGNRFGRQKTIDLLDAEKFEPYVMNDGTICKWLQVSRSGRWFCVAGHYYPIYLVRGYDGRSRELLMIDGTRIKQPWLETEPVKAAMKELFAANRIFEKGLKKRDITGICATAFNRAWGQNYEALANADWDVVRYKWEQEVADLAASGMELSSFNKFRKALSLDDYAKESLQTRVLTDDEIDYIVQSIRRKEIKSTDGWFVISSYKDEMCICNGVKLLNRLGYPDNAMGDLFLFNCIRDIQKPYFEEAIEALKKFPRDLLIEMLETRVAVAHQEGDVLWGAGLIYLAKQIDYEISIARESREEFLGQFPGYTNFTDFGDHSQGQYQEKPF